MAGMVGNQYQDMAKQIMAEMSAGAPPKAMPVQAKRKILPEEMEETPKEEMSETPEHEAGGGEALSTVEAEMKSEGMKEGTDEWYSERAARIIDYFDPSEFVRMPAEQAFKELGLSMTPEDAQIYDEADPDMRFEMLDFLTNGPTGSLAEFNGMVEDSKYGSAPTQMKKKVVLEDDYQNEREFLEFKGMEFSPENAEIVRNFSTDKALLEDYYNANGTLEGFSDWKDKYDETRNNHLNAGGDDDDEIIYQKMRGEE